MRTSNINSRRRSERFSERILANKRNKYNSGMIIKEEFFKRITKQPKIKVIKTSKKSN